MPALVLMDLRTAGLAVSIVGVALVSDPASLSTAGLIIVAIALGRAPRHTHVLSLVLATAGVALYPDLAYMFVTAWLPPGLMPRYWPLIIATYYVRAQKFAFICTIRFVTEAWLWHRRKRAEYEYDDLGRRASPGDRGLRMSGSHTLPQSQVYAIVYDPDSNFESCLDMATTITGAEMYTWNVPWILLGLHQVDAAIAALIRLNRGVVCVWRDPNLMIDDDHLGHVPVSPLISEMRIFAIGRTFEERGVWLPPGLVPAALQSAVVRSTPSWSLLYDRELALISPRPSVDNSGHYTPFSPAPFASWSEMVHVHVPARSLIGGVCALCLVIIVHGHSVYIAWHRETWNLLLFIAGMVLLTICIITLFARKWPWRTEACAVVVLYAAVFLHMIMIDHEVELLVVLLVPGLGVLRAYLVVHWAVRVHAQIFPTICAIFAICATHVDIREWNLDRQVDEQRKRPSLTIDEEAPPYSVTYDVPECLVIGMVQADDGSRDQAWIDEPLLWQPLGWYMGVRYYLDTTPMLTNYARTIQSVEKSLGTSCMWWIGPMKKCTLHLGVGDVEYLELGSDRLDDDTKRSMYDRLPPTTEIRLDHVPVLRVTAASA